MGFRRRSSRRRTSSGRKTYWAFAQPQLLETTFNSPRQCYTGWASYPSGHVDPVTSRLIPSDETAVRVIMNSQLLYNTDALEFVTSPVLATIGLIAYDGGTNPSYYDGTLFSPTSAGAPPFPNLNAGDDWIIRQPMIFQAGNSYQGPVATQFIESKAMRKLPPGRGILWCLEVTDPNSLLGSMTFSGGSDIRIAMRSGFTA